jgi:hypothetical protein
VQGYSKLVNMHIRARMSLADTTRLGDTGTSRVGRTPENHGPKTASVSEEGMLLLPILCFSWLQVITTALQTPVSDTRDLNRARQVRWSARTKGGCEQRHAKGNAMDSIYLHQAPRLKRVRRAHYRLLLYHGWPVPGLSNHEWDVGPVPFSRPLGHLGVVADCEHPACLRSSPTACPFCAADQLKTAPAPS